jgi:5-methylcytosine-specific restriction endonuclease McrA
MSGVPAAIRKQIRQRAYSRCEYCRLPEALEVYPFHVEHIISKKHDGTDDIENLAWACFQCNIAKGTDVAGYDRETGELTPVLQSSNTTLG